MITARLLLILSQDTDSCAAEATIRAAISSAGRPLALRFAVPLALEASLSIAPEEADILFYHAENGLASLLPELTDETHFLLLGGPYAFCAKWDQNLLRALRPLGRRALLTGCMLPCSAPDADPADAPTQRIPKLGSDLSALRKSLQERQQRPSAEDARIAHPHTRFHKAEVSQSEAYLPALKESLDENTITIGRGLPLVCADGPVQTLLIDPALLMGPVSFLEECDLTPETLSLAAYVAGYSIHALHEPWLWPAKDLPVRILRKPASDVLPGTTVARFEQLLGFHYGQPHTVGKAAMGLFIPEDVYEQKMPIGLRLQQAARSARLQWKETHMPLLVSAFIDLPSPRNSHAFYTLRFGFLRRIASLPLLLFTGGSQERALRSSFPNTQSYPDNSLLPLSLLQEGMRPDQHFTRSKPLLMMRAAKKRAEFTHVAWLDMDVLPHPICREAVPDLHSLMDDRIHMATVGGIPDASFLVIPVKYLPAIVRQTISITQLDAELQRDFSEEMLWQRLFHKKPDWFALHAMPRRRLLFLSLFDRELLSTSLRAHLADLPKPYYASQADFAPASPTVSKEL